MRDEPECGRLIGRIKKIIKHKIKLAKQMQAT